MFQAIRKYFSAEASAQRQRNAERHALGRELLALAQSKGAWADGRIGYCGNRLIELDKLDVVAALQADGVPERRKAYRLVEPAPAHVIEDEVLRELRLVPR